MAPAQPEAFMEDSEDTCPLCVEEFDLSDKNFRPCPCGYQICQFCYNNIKTNMNGLCPACRRPYDDKNIEWKIISPEEFKADVANQARRKAAMRQKEAERKQVETLNRKHLQGLRVVQRNLVYITGMQSEGVPDDLLEEQLKATAVFGQYGRIIKLSANKLKDTGPGNVALAIFITFADEDAASRCIAALDGKVHQNRILKAQHGTTKYCSAFLRNEICNNRNCTFLHETGEDRDSFSRQELSSLNAASSQARPAGTSTPAPRPAPPQQTPSAIGGPSTQPMSRSDSGDGPALPSTANWAKNPQLQQSRRSSLAASRATPSPKTAHAKTILTRPASRTSSKAVGPSTTVKEREVITETQPTTSTAVASRKANNTTSAEQMPSESFIRLYKAVEEFVKFQVSWSLDKSTLDEEVLRTLETHPPLIDPHGGAARAALRQRQERMRQKQDEARSVVQTTTVTDDDDHRLGGSLQLGGEPDVGEDAMDSRSRGAGSSIFQPQPFDTGAADSQPFGQSALTNDFSSLDQLSRGQQRGGVSLLKNNQDNDAILQQFQRAPTTSQHHSTLSNPFAGQQPVLSAHSRHGRQSSRFTFANDAASATASVKSTANPLIPQQSGLMSNQTKQYTGQANMQTGFYSGVQGPPPGLKSSGTPPISGGGMFGQGHGFASAMGGSLSFSNSHLPGKNNENDLLSMRGRAGTGGGLGPDAGKQLDSTAPAYDPLDLLGRGSPRPIVRSKPKIESQDNEQSATPTAPPGLGTNEFPPLAPMKAKDASSVAIGKEKTTASKATTPGSARKGKQKEVIVEEEVLQNAKSPATKIQKKEDESTATEREEDQLVAAEAPEQDDSGRKNVPLESTDRENVKTTQRVADTIAQPERRQKPGKLDIAAAQDAAKQEFKAEDRDSKKETSVAMVDKKDTASVDTGPSRSATPATAAGTPASGVPVTRGPRTIRVIDTPKVETPKKQTITAKAAADSTPASASAASAKTPSRRPSIGSINVPSTPSGDLHSETASWTESRPGSPAGGKTALPTRVKTKSQAKKERRIRKTEESKLSESMSVDIEEPEVVQEAIIGRKKKAKKEKPVFAKTTVKAGERGEDPKQDSDEKGELEAQPDRSAITSPAQTEPEPDSATPKVPLTTKERVERMSLADLLQWYTKGFDCATQAADLLTSPPNWKPSPVTARTVLPQLSDKELELLDTGKPILVQSEIDPEDITEPEQTIDSPYVWTIILPDSSHTILKMATRAEGELYLSIYEQLLRYSTSASSSILNHHPPRSESIPASASGPDFITALLKGGLPDLFNSLWDIFPPTTDLDTAPAGPSGQPSTAGRVNDLIRNDGSAAKWMDENIREIEHAEALVGGDYFARRRAAALGHGPVSLDSVAAAAPPPGSTTATVVPPTLPSTPAAPPASTPANQQPITAVPGIGSMLESRPTAPARASTSASAAARRNAAALSNASTATLAYQTMGSWMSQGAMGIQSQYMNNDDLADELLSMPALADIERRLRESESYVAMSKREDENQEKRFQAALRKNSKVLRRGSAKV